MALFTCNGVSMQYEGQRVVTDVSFSVEAGDYLCIVGENGSGKSTLMRGILGLKALSAGSITFDKSLRRTQIGYLPQQTAAQKEFPTSVREVVLSGCLNRSGLLPVYSAADRARAKHAMERLAVYDLRRSSFKALSGGQRQRVLLARALCATETLLLLDEPVSALDPVATAEFYDIISALNRKDGITVVMISHDILAAVSHANRILHLDNTVSYFGDCAGYRHSEAGSRFFRCEHTKADGDAPAEGDCACGGE